MKEEKGNGLLESGGTKTKPVKQGSQRLGRALVPAL